MNTHDEFEAHLRGELSLLGDRAPAGPSAERVLAALAARSRRRRWFAGGCGAAAAATLAVVIAIGSAERQQASIIGRLAWQPAKVDAANASAEPTATHSTSASGADDSTWSLIPSSLSIAAPAPAAAPLHEARFDMDLSLSLRLALSEPGEEMMPVLRFASPSWR